MNLGRVGPVDVRRVGPGSKWILNQVSGSVEPGPKWIRDLIPSGLGTRGPGPKRTQALWELVLSVFGNCWTWSQVNFEPGPKWFRDLWGLVPSGFGTCETWSQVDSGPVGPGFKTCGT
jgi:hypothetical protein